MFEHLVSIRLRRFVERSGVLLKKQFSYKKGLGGGDTLLCISNTLQSALENGQEARIVQIDFRLIESSCRLIDDWQFDMVNRLGILNKLCSVGIGSSVLFILTVSIKPNHSTFWWLVV